MSDYKTVNGYDVKLHEHKNNRIPNHARKLCAALDRDNPAIERIDYTGFCVSVWMDADAPRSSFEIPDGWQVDRTGVYGGAVCLDLEREGER